MVDSNNGRVTNRMLWDSVRDVSHKLDTLTGGVANIDKKVAVLCEANLPVRVGILEGWRNRIVGVGAVAVVLIPLVSAFLARHF